MPQQSKSKHKRDRGQLRTFKVIEEQKRKEEFFAEIVTELESKFPKEHLDFFVETSARNFYINRTLRKIFGDTTGQPLKTDSRASEAEEAESLQENEIKKIDPCLFQNIRNHQPVNGETKFSFPQQRKCPATPKNRQSIPLKMQKKMFEVNTKMKNNYERVKQRIFFNTPETTFRATNSVRRSLAYYPTMAKTQRAFRYNTECSDGPGDEAKVPRMLMGELAYRRTESKEGGVERLGREQKDRRWECLRREGVGSVRRYKCRQ